MVPVAAVAEIVAGSAMLVRSAAMVLDVPGNVIVLVTRAVPVTSRVLVGEAVPMPTRPAAVMRIRSAKPDPVIPFVVVPKRREPAVAFQYIAESALLLFVYKVKGYVDPEVIKLSPDALATCKVAVGEAVPMPTRPPAVMRIFSV